MAVVLTVAEFAVVLTVAEFAVVLTVAEFAVVLTVAEFPVVLAVAEFAVALTVASVVLTVASVVITVAEFPSAVAEFLSSLASATSSLAAIHDSSLGSLSIVGLPVAKTSLLLSVGPGSVTSSNRSPSVLLVEAVLESSCAIKIGSGALSRMIKTGVVSVSRLVYVYSTTIARAATRGTYNSVLRVLYQVIARYNQSSNANIAGVSGYEFISCRSAVTPSSPTPHDDSTNMAAGLTFEEQLRELKIEEVEETGEELGRGSYGVVVEIKTSGLRCAGKKLHDSFFAFASPQEKRAIKERFVEECLRLGRLRHPNIVQLLGVHFRRGSAVPTLIMEYLPMTLSQCLERYPDIPDYLKNSVLHDVALGLLYLHQQVPAIIHRDLTANNVLLASTMSAKIADLGVARIVNLNPAQMTAKMTICPGTPAYMPPEALSNKPLYNTSLDCFSYGNLIVHTVVQNWPLPLPLLQADSQNPGLLKPLTEVERRAEYLEQMGGVHPLRQMAERCLHNDPRQRPTAARIVQELEHVTASHPPPFANVIEMVRDLSHKTERISNHQVILVLSIIKVFL